MTNRKGLYLIGLLYGGMTLMVTMMAVMVVSAHVLDGASLDVAPAASVEISAISRQ